jgi:type IV secretion system protein VirB9
MKSSYNYGLIALLALILNLGDIGVASATREPHPIQVDHRVRLITYQPDEVYKYTGHYRYASQIEFSPEEEIKTISMGDSTSWMLNPAGFRLFLKPLEQDATTNMTVITNLHTYLFELHARETDDIDDKDMVFIMRFVYPEGTSGQAVSHFLDTVPSPEDEPGLYNTKYTISGPDEIAPIRIFDDGLFTYFQFRNKNADLPAFYTVDTQGNESIINYRTRGDYIVVERVAKKFTLRHGAEIVCVFNEGKTLSPVVPAKQ